MLYPKNMVGSGLFQPILIFKISKSGKRVDPPLEAYNNVNELKKCKNAGCNAYFLICFENKYVKQLDIDLVIGYLKQNKKSIKKYGLPEWELLKELEEI